MHTLASAHHCPTPASERRSADRALIRCQVQSPLHVLKAVTLDVSPTGLRLECDQSLSLGAGLLFEINTGEEILPCGGKVRWQRRAEKPGHYEVGVQFFHPLDNRWQKPD